jgi:hypothetical protein
MGALLGMLVACADTDRLRHSPQLYVQAVLFAAGVTLRRNWVLGTNTLQAAQASAQHAPGRPVVAVVGKGHIPGMVYVIEQVVEAYAHAHGATVEAADSVEAAAAEASAADGEQQ